VPIVDEARNRHHRAMMSGSDSSATATLTPTPTSTPTPTPTSVAVISAASSADEEEEEDSAALTLDCVESGADMDLVNGPNPWLPAYGFQLQHHSHFQPTHLEDLRPNGSFPLSFRCFFFHTRAFSLLPLFLHVDV